MKYRYILLLIVLISTFSCRLFHKQEYVFPPNTPPEAKPSLLQHLALGKKLYKVDCAECHGIFTQGKDGVPNFSQTQIDRYSSRFVMRDPKNHAVAFKMNPEDLNNVLLYLRYRKKTGKPATLINPSATAKGDTVTTK